MEPKELKALKERPKTLKEFPKFFSGTHGKDYPKPLKQLRKWDRVTDLIEVADHQVVVFAYRRRELAIDCKFYAYWGFRIDITNELTPIAIMHYHPDHKGIHIKLPCQTKRDYTSRELPGAPELNVYNNVTPDIREDSGVRDLISLFCEASGITIQEKNVRQGTLFES